MTTNRSSATVAVLLVVEAGFALLAVLAHHAFTVEYGDVTLTALGGLAWGMTAGLTGVALIPVVVVGAIAIALSRQRWARLTAVAILILTLLAMLTVTPWAQRQRLETQFNPTPQCVSSDSRDDGAAAEVESQRIFDSIDHIGNFSGGGASGVGGCDRSFVVLEDVDVLQHYRAALSASGWELIEDDGRHLRAERDGQAFKVMLCSEFGVVWAGRADEDYSPQCGF